MYYVYVLKSTKDQRFYIGFTKDLKNRVKEHNAGEVKSTKDRKPMKLIFYEAFLEKQDALRREGYFKTTKGKKVLRLMLRSFISNSVSSS
ncbi:MAG TPA: GIY-YIG nuclease family protein [Candidatus Magasanikbacteria bacterium]|nr:GIY-YIG nuclease family protein [Candidatus Magasanikbacteria bacterium]